MSRSSKSDVEEEATLLPLSSRWALDATAQWEDITLSGMEAPSARPLRGNRGGKMRSPSPLRQLRREAGLPYVNRTIKRQPDGPQPITRQLSSTLFPLVPRIDDPDPTCGDIVDSPSPAVDTGPHVGSLMALASLDQPGGVFSEHEDGVLVRAEQRKHLLSFVQSLAALTPGADDDAIFHLAHALRGSTALMTLTSLADRSAVDQRLSLSVLSNLCRLGLGHMICQLAPVRAVIIRGLLAGDTDEETAACALPCAFLLCDDDLMLRALRGSSDLITPILIRWVLAGDATISRPKVNLGGSARAAHKRCSRVANVPHLACPHFWVDAEMAAEMARCAAVLLRNMRASQELGRASVRVLREAGPVDGSWSATERLSRWLAWMRPRGSRPPKRRQQQRRKPSGTVVEV